MVRWLVVHAGLILLSLHKTSERPQPRRAAAFFLRVGT